MRPYIGDEGYKIDNPASFRGAGAAARTDILLSLFCCAALRRRLMNLPLLTCGFLALPVLLQDRSSKYV